MKPISILIATSLCLTLVACGSSKSKNTTKPVVKPVPKPTPVSVVAYQTTDCKSMLSSAQQSSLTVGSRCGYLTVPERHAYMGKPASQKTIQIAVVKLATTSTSKQTDPVVFMQGGPGGTGTSSLAMLASGPLIKNRDVYVVDQRGTGYSKPALLCSEYSGLQGTPAQISACKARLSKQGHDLAAYNSAQNALDFVELRKALKIESWNLYGFSYGTRLASTLMRETSQGVRSVILDGMFPIEVNGISDTPWANYASLDQIIKSCQRSTNCPSNLKATIESVISRLQNAGKLAQSRVFVQQLLNKMGSAELLTFVANVDKNPNIIQLPQAGGEVFYAPMALSPVCSEEYPFLNQTALTGPNNQNWSQTTRITVDSMFHMGFDAASCKAWNVPAANDIETKPVTSNLPVLILNGDNDSQTPPAWGALVAKNMPNAQDYTNPIGGHGQMGENTCFNSLIEQFLAAPNNKVNASCVSQIAPFKFN